MAYSQKLYVDYTGLIYVVVEDGKMKGSKYPCSASQYDMSINSIPTFTAHVGGGTSIKDPKVTYNPEDLIIAIQEHDESEMVKRFTRCSIYEEADPKSGGKDRLIFKGYIIAAQVLYTASAKNGISYRLTCMGLGAALFVTPISGYMEMSFSQIMDTRGKDRALTFEAALATGGEYIAQGHDLIPVMQQNCMQLPIHIRIAHCIEVLQRAGSYKDATEFLDDSVFTFDPDVMEVFGGNTNLKLDAFGGDVTCDGEYTKRLAENFLAGLQSSSIYETISRTLTSLEFSLQLLPRWSCDAKDDFKMEISPITAWKPRDIIELSSEDVVSMRVVHNTAGALNTPDVLIVNFDEILGFTRNGAGTGLAGVYGIAAKDEKIEKALQSALLTDDLNALLDEQGKKYRIKILDAPKWLASVATIPGVVDNKDRDLNKNPNADKQPENTEAQQPQNNSGNPEVRRVADKTSALGMANVLAKVMFLYLYMIDDTVAVELMPNLRFGRDPKKFFENSLGDTIVVDLTGNGAVKSKMKIKGVLQSVSYEQTASESSNSNYFIALERVRLADVKVPDVECPIYTVAPKFSEGN